jgi:hypothetical protein
MKDMRGNLIGYKTAFELMLGNIGVPGRLISPDGSYNVKELEHYFINQRDHIRDLRHSYIEAYLDGEMIAAEKIQQKYLADYGGPIEVRQQDWNAAYMRRFVPRMERIAKTFSVDVRDRFLRVAQTALAGSGQRFLGVDPILFSQPRKELHQLLGPQGPQFQGAQ